MDMRMALRIINKEMTRRGWTKEMKNEMMRNSSESKENGGFSINVASSPSRCMNPDCPCPNERPMFSPFKEFTTDDAYQRCLSDLKSLKATLTSQQYKRKSRKVFRTFVIAMQELEESAGPDTQGYKLAALITYKEALRHLQPVRSALIQYYDGKEIDPPHAAEAKLREAYALVAFCQARKRASQSDALNNPGLLEKEFTAYTKAALELKEISDEVGQFIMIGLDPEDRCKDGEKRQKVVAIQETDKSEVLVIDPVKAAAATKQVCENKSLDDAGRNMNKPDVSDENTTTAAAAISSDDLTETSRAPKIVYAEKVDKPTRRGVHLSVVEEEALREGLDNMKTLEGLLNEGDINCRAIKTFRLFLVAMQQLSEGAGEHADSYKRAAMLYYVEAVAQLQFYQKYNLCVRQSETLVVKEQSLHTYDMFMACMKAMKQLKDIEIDKNPVEFGHACMSYVKAAQQLKEAKAAEGSLDDGDLSCGSILIRGTPRVEISLDSFAEKSVCQSDPLIGTAEGRKQSTVDSEEALPASEPSLVTVEENGVRYTEIDNEAAICPNKPSIVSAEDRNQSTHVNEETLPAREAVICQSESSVAVEVERQSNGVDKDATTAPADEEHEYSDSERLETALDKDQLKDLDQSVSFDTSLVYDAMTALTGFIGDDDKTLNSRDVQELRLRVVDLQKGVATLQAKNQKVVTNLRHKKILLEQAASKQKRFEEEMHNQEAILHSRIASLRGGLDSVTASRENLKNKLRIEKELLTQARVDKEKLQRQLKQSEKARAMERELLDLYRELANHTGYYTWGKRIRILEAELSDQQSHSLD